MKRIWDLTDKYIYTNKHKRYFYYYFILPFVNYLMLILKIKPYFWQQFMFFLKNFRYNAIIWRGHRTQLWKIQAYFTHLVGSASKWICCKICNFSSDFWGCLQIQRSYFLWHFLIFFTRKFMKLASVFSQKLCNWMAFSIFC